MFKFIFKFKSLAFTLAEVMMVLGIIGIVAEMTLPVLISNVQAEILQSQFKKEKSTIYAIFQKLALDNSGDISSIDLSSQIGNYVKLTENCFQDGTYKCWHKNNEVKIYQSDGSFKYTLGQNSHAVSFVDGSMLEFSPGPLVCKANPSWSATNSCRIRTATDGFCGNLMVDINGEKGPNIWGNDIREIDVWSDGYINFYGEKVASHSRYTDTLLQDPPAYKVGGACYDGNSYSTTNYN